MLSGLLATAGDSKNALRKAFEIPDAVFESQGGEGHSLTNTLWYIATRREAKFTQLDDIILGDNATTSVNTSKETPEQ